MSSWTVLARPGQVCLHLPQSISIATSFSKSFLHDVLKASRIQPSKVLSASQDIKVKIVSIDTSAKRISLSYKETLDNPWKKIEDQIGKVVKVKVKNITDKSIFAELDSGLVGMLHYKEISFSENENDLKNYKKNDLIEAKIVDIKDEKIRFSIRALARDPMDWFKENKKKVGDIITTRIFEVMKTGVKVSVDPEKKIIVTIRKSQLAKEASDQRPEVYSVNNALDAKITELDLNKRIPS